MTTQRVVRLGACVSLRIHRREALVSTVIAVLVLAVLVVSLATGAYAVSVGEVVATLVGHGRPASEIVVMDLRLPRALSAIGCGAALGVAGCLVQSVTRNPLGSPDVIGFTQGAAASAVFALTVWHVGVTGMAVAAAVGGAATAAGVYLLAFRRGVQGHRLVLVGVGAGAVMLAVVHYLLTRSELDEAVTAQVWLVGSLGNATWSGALLACAPVLLLVPVALAVAGRLRVLETGDHLASALGLAVQRSRLAAVAVAVLLSGTATACAGPVAFVALSAPQLARRLTGRSGPGVLSAAGMGALVLLVADYTAQHAFGGTALPVGVLTGVVGGLYLAWLLSRQRRTV